MISEKLPPIDSSIEQYIKTVMGKKAMEIIVLDLRGLSSVADVFILCHGRSHRQVSAIAEFIRTELKKQRLMPLNVEGIAEGHWVLLDYGHVIMHVFYEPVRRFYNLEGLWVDARRINFDHLKNL